MSTHSLKEAVLSLAGLTAALTCRQDHVDTSCKVHLLTTACQSQRRLRRLSATATSLTGEVALLPYRLKFWSDHVHI